jgi:hypothetical protein
MRLPASRSYRKRPTDVSLTAMRIAFATLRVGIAAAIVAAIVGQLLLSLGYWESIGVENRGAHVVHFFSFFTIESNVLSVVAMLVGAYFLLFRRGDDPAWYGFFRAAVVTYMVTTGIVYNILLRGVELPQGSTLGWSNEILHLIGPVYLLVDWLFAPGRTPLGAKKLLGVIVFPLVWVAYTLIRGPFATDYVQGNSYWYPYPFLNPNLNDQGYGVVAIYAVAIAAVIALVASGVLWLSRHQGSR